MTSCRTDCQTLGYFSWWICAWAVAQTNWNRTEKPLLLPVAAHGALLNIWLAVSHKGLDILQRSRRACKWQRRAEGAGGRGGSRGTPGCVYALMIHERPLPVLTWLKQNITRRKGRRARLRRCKVERVSLPRLPSSALCFLSKRLDFTVFTGDNLAFSFFSNFFFPVVGKEGPREYYSCYWV